MTTAVDTETKTLEELADAITMTDDAKVRLRRLIQRKAPDNPEMGLRIGVRGGGCSGLNYFMNLDDKINAKWDHVFDLGDGIRVICDKKSLLYLKGSTIKWSGNLMSGGFEFENPNASKSCGCGTSFSL